jgi:hypothetical protein
LFNTSEWLSLCIIVGCLAEINRQLFNTSEWLSLCIIVGCLAGMNCLLFSISSTISTILHKLVSIQFPHDLILRSPMLLTWSIVYDLLWRCGEFFSVYCDSWLIRLLSFNVYIYALKKTVTWLLCSSTMNLAGNVLTRLHLWLEHERIFSAAYYSFMSICSQLLL